jgi:Na+-translocating ferredoxin:NAD+ oxidoreductase subunit D
MIVAFPALMSQWPPAGLLSLDTQINLILGGSREIDGITGATALDSLRTGLRAGTGTVETVMQGSAFGLLGGRGWEWVSVGYIAGGIFLLAMRVITWHMPVAFIGSLAGISGLFWLINPDQFASPLFHLASGGAMLAAFFIVTDPVSGATTPRGKLLFAGGIGVIAWLIRSFGAYPEGIAFGVLLLNMCVPLIDMKTQPKVFGHRKADAGDSR